MFKDFMEYRSYIFRYQNGLEYWNNPEKLEEEFLKILSLLNKGEI